MSNDERLVKVSRDAPDPQEAGGSAVPRTRWILALAAASLLFVGHLLVERFFPLDVPDKGTIARRTYRAPTDAVFDLHETFAAEARAAKQSYLPIYDLDAGLLLRQKEPMLSLVLGQSAKSWPWPVWHRDPIDAGPGDPGLGSSSDARPGDGVARGPRAARGDAKLRWDGAPRARDAGVAAADGRSPADGGSAAARGTRRLEELPWQVRSQRRRDLQKLAYGCFKLLEPYYQRGVIADSEFPNEKPRIRLRDRRGRLRQLQVSRLYRFSELHAALERSTKQFFYHVPELVRRRLIDFLLQRLPPNVVYAKDNDKFIADISQVTGLKVIPIRRGEILVARGRTVDLRAHQAIRASVAAASATPAWLRLLARALLTAGLLLLFVIAVREVTPLAFARRGTLLLVFGGLLLFSIGGAIVLGIWPINPMLLPQASMALIVAVVLGRAPAILTAVTVAAGLGLTLHFDLPTLVVGTVGGVMAALLVRQRRRAAVLPAGILVGLAQALALEATRAAAGQVQGYPEMWAAAQAFAGGLLAGVVALLALPFVQRALGIASRGQLHTLGDYEHAMARRLRDHRPEVFAHTLRVISLSDCAAKAISADRLLCRVGALYHDIGKLRAPGLEGPLEDPLEAARQRRAHVEVGGQLGREERLPAELLAFIAEHHGTLEMGGLLTVLPRSPSPQERRQLRFAGPRPQTVEVAIVMIANRIDHQLRPLPPGTTHDLEQARALVEGVIVDLLSQFQFAECRITQRQLRRMERALVDYLLTL